jgi:hypothetical protein
MQAPPPLVEDADSSSGHRRASSLIALSLIAMVATGLAYLHQPSISNPVSTASGSSLPPVARSISVKPPPMPLTQVFRSPNMQYAINFPAGWTATPASQLLPGESDRLDEQNADKLDGGSVLFTGTSEPLAGGQSPASWIGWYLATVGTKKCGVREYTDFMGLTGLIDLNGCSSTDMPGHIYSAAVVIDGRGYSFSIQGKVDHALFVAMLRTVRFGS